MIYLKMKKMLSLILLIVGFLFTCLIGYWIAIDYAPKNLGLYTVVIPICLGSYSVLKGNIKKQERKLHSD